jgi:hypothetical protein
VAPAPAPIDAAPAPVEAAPAPAPVPAPAPPPRRAPPPRTAAATSSIDLRSSPSGAQIYVDGKLRGTTPRRLELATPATILLRYRGYQPARVRAVRSGPLDVRLVRSCQHPPCEDLN